MSESPQILTYQSRAVGNSRLRSAAWILLMVIGSVTATGGMTAGGIGLWFAADPVAFQFAVFFGGIPLVLGVLELIWALRIRRRLERGADIALLLVLIQTVLLVGLSILVIDIGIASTVILVRFAVPGVVLVSEGTLLMKLNSEEDSDAHKRSSP